MSWLTPLGFLGLIGLIILIIIYIIKPNYQQKFISTTYVWKRSLKFKKKRLPINRLQDILLFLCQVLIITTMAAVLAQPFIDSDEEMDVAETIVILDASASMLTETEGETRFTRAVYQICDLAEGILEKEGSITVILAGEESSFLIQNMDATMKDDLMATLQQLAETPADKICTYGEADIKGAIKLAEQITSENDNVEVMMYTDVQYVDAGRVKVVNMAAEQEWNAAILDVRGIMFENYYRFEIDVACYGDRDADIPVTFEIFGVNEVNSTLELQATARCKAGKTETIVFANYHEDDPDDTITEDTEVYSFDYAVARVDENDNFELDNTFYLYGGKKQTLKIQYCSSMPNNYFATALDVIRDRFGSKWDVEFKEVLADEEPAMDGYDVYIFEHEMPTTLPIDGLVILSNPDKVSISTGLRLGKTFNGAMDNTFTQGEDHPIMAGIKAENIIVTKFTEITSYDGYTPLMYCFGKPVVMAKNEPDQKIVVMSFSMNYSDFAMVLEFPLFLTNILNYYIPATMTEYVFDVNETIELNCRSQELRVVGPGTDVTMNTFPGTLKLKTPGVYTATQTPISGTQVVETFYVRLPASESNTAAVVDVLENPYFMEAGMDDIQDLLVYFAMALVILLFVEWWLQSRKQF